MTYRLYDFTASPFCLKARAILDYKGLAYERLNVVGPQMVKLKLKGKIGKVPALEMEGKLVCDSTDIAYALEERHPEPPIIPADPVERARCHVLEDWADESLYFYGLYFRWVDPEGKAGARSGLGKNLATRAVMSAMLARGAKTQVTQQGLGRKPLAHVERDLTRHLDTLSRLLADQPFLLGETPMLCDFAVCGQLVYLDRTPHGGRQISRYPALFKYLRRMKALRDK